MNFWNFFNLEKKLKQGNSDELESAHGLATPVRPNGQITRPAHAGGVVGAHP
jgi:hypothetical protein